MTMFVVKNPEGLYQQRNDQEEAWGPLSSAVTFRDEKYARLCCREGDTTVPVAAREITPMPEFPPGLPGLTPRAKLAVLKACELWYGSLFLAVEAQKWADWEWDCFIQEHALMIQTLDRLLGETYDFGGGNPAPVGDPA